MQDLENLRAKIDGIDGKIIVLLAKRRNYSLKIGKYKQNRGLTIRDTGRENEIMDSRIKKGLSLKIPSTLIKSLFKDIFADSRLLQKKNRPRFDKKAKN